MKCIDDLITGIQNDPCNPELYYERGVAFFNERYYDESISDFLISESLGYDNPKLYLYLGKSTYSIGNSAQSLDYIERYVKLCPEDMEGKVLKGEMLVNLGRYEESLSEYKDAIFNNGLDPSILNEISIRLSSEGNFEAARLFNPNVESKKRSLFGRG